METQYYFVGIAVFFIVVCQFSSYAKNELRIRRLKELFPNKTVYTTDTDDEKLSIHCKEGSSEFGDTLNDLNSYLRKNENKTFDYHIIKEIVDRNAQSLEDEVDTMLSAPLYLGLIATILGIAVGIVMFAHRDLGAMLGQAELDPTGIKILLTDIGIAMGASLFGVLFTKMSTSSFNEAKSVMAKNKNRFLTWIQADLMPKLSDDLTGAIFKMTQDLNEFNRTFAGNTRELRATLQSVRDSYEGQAQLLEAIDKLKINKIAAANIAVYDRLQGCTEELEHLFEILSDSESYVQNVIELNTKLGSIEERTRLFEELGNYFMNEVEYVKDRQGMMRQQMSSLDSVLQDALSNMGGSLKESIGQLTKIFQLQNQNIQMLIEEQQKTLAESIAQQQKTINERVEQMANPFDGLKETFAAGIGNMQSVFAKQNQAIKDMLEEQRKMLEDSLLAQQKLVLSKMSQTPNQVKALSDLPQSLERLNDLITVLGREVHHLNNPVNEQAKGNSWMVKICAAGSFAALLAMLALQIIQCYDIRI